VIRWEALNGMSMVEVGKRRNGKPHNVLLLNVLVAVSETDAKLVMRKVPSLKFVKKGRK
jgi:hypothetical protein